MCSLPNTLRATQIDLRAPSCPSESTPGVVRSIQLSRHTLRAIDQSRRWAFTDLSG